MFDNKKYFFDDLEIGQTFDMGGAVLSKEKIIEFAKEYDPQIFHLDEEVGTAILGGLAASGWQTAALCQRMLVDHFLDDVACMASPGVENLNFVRPVFADDPLTGTTTIAEKRLSKSNPSKGLVKLKGEVKNSKGEVVLSMIGLILVAVRPEA
ncbi:MAG: MaoC family dehydratase [Pseudomonadota bacterium]|nr:MaoC family dehydratase [Pseudomonadota bacterium]